MLPPSAVLVVCLVGSRLGDVLGDAGDEVLPSRDARFVRWEGAPVSVVTAISERAFQLSEVLQRTARFFSAIATTYDEDNEIDREDKAPTEMSVHQDDTPSAALHGMYSECVLRLSVPCVQKKLMLFLDRLGRMEKLRLLGDFLSVVRVEPREAGDTNYTADNEDSLAEQFFATHSVRFSLPGTLRIARSPGLRTTVDLHFSKIVPDKDNVGEGRGPLSGGGGGKQTKKKQKMLRKIKKRLMKVLMMLMSVMMVMGPMMGGMAGGQAMLALLMGSLSLLISKALIIKKLGGSVTGLLGNIGSSIGNLAGIGGGGGSGGGGGGGSSSYFPTSSGGGPYSRIDPVAVDWARSFGSDVGSTFDPMTLVYKAYNMASYLR